MGFFKECRIVKLKAEAAYQTAFADAYEKQIRSFGQATSFEIEAVCKARAKAAKAQSKLNSIQGDA